MISEYGIIGARNGPFTSNPPTYFVHMLPKDIQRSLSASVWENSVRICNIRNPYSRMLSRFTRLQRIGQIKTNTFDETRAAFKSELCKTGQIKIPHKDHFYVDDTFAFSEIVFFEDYPTQVQRLFTILQLPTPENLEHHQGSENDFSRTDPSDIFDSEMIDRVLQDFGWVFDRFGYSTDPTDMHLLPTAIKNQTAPENFTPENQCRVQ